MAAVSGTVLWASATKGSAAAQTDSIHVGRGMADMTGEPWGAGMNGYAVLEQTSVGLQRRQYARAFIFVDPATQRRVVEVVADIGLMFQSIFLEVLRRLKTKYGDLYSDHNVLIHATHTHVAPGGTSGHLMVDITTQGFRDIMFEANVSGIVAAIERAHDDVQPAQLTLAKGTLSGASANRSRQAWEQNPESDRANFPDAIDPHNVTLHIERNGQPVGFINWFAVHATSMSSEYRHVAIDNKGYAAWATEEALGVDHRHPEEASFVAAFAQSSPGDMTPNLGLTPGTGPGEDDVSHARIIGERHMRAVADAGDGEPVAGGGVDGIFRWVDCSDIAIDAQWTTDGKPGHTRPAILGAAFAALAGSCSSRMALKRQSPPACAYAVPSRRLGSASRQRHFTGGTSMVMAITSPHQRSMEPKTMKVARQYSDAISYRPSNKPSTSLPRRSRKARGLIQDGRRVI